MAGWCDASFSRMLATLALAMLVPPSAASYHSTSLPVPKVGSIFTDSSVEGRLLCGRLFCSAAGFSLRGGGDLDAESAALDQGILHKTRGAKLWGKEDYDGAAQEFQAALDSLPMEKFAAKERVNCLNNLAACMIKLDRVSVLPSFDAICCRALSHGPRMRERIVSTAGPLEQAEEAVKFCSDAMSMDPANKKARLRRGLALEKLGLDALGGADMVLLLAEDKTIPQARAMLERVSKKGDPNLREDITAQILSVLNKQAATPDNENRARAAHFLVESIFVTLLGLAPTPPPGPPSEGPRNAPKQEEEELVPVSVQSGSAPAKTEPSETHTAGEHRRNQDPTQAATVQDESGGGGGGGGGGGDSTSGAVESGTENIRNKFARNLQTKGGGLASVNEDIVQLAVRVEVLSERVNGLDDETLLKHPPQAKKQLAKMLQSAVEFGELGIMLICSMDNMQISGDGEAQMRKDFVKRVQKLIDAADAAKATIQERQQLFVVPDPPQVMAAKAILGGLKKVWSMRVHALVVAAGAAGVSLSTQAGGWEPALAILSKEAEKFGKEAERFGLRAASAAGNWWGGVQRKYFPTPENRQPPRPRQGSGATSGVPPAGAGGGGGYEDLRRGGMGTRV